MRHSIETRLPFLDYRLVEFCISIPAAHKIHDGWTKYVLRRAMEDVLLPEIDATLSAIDTALEELEREESVRVRRAAG